MTMVERVARAICTAQGYDPDFSSINAAMKYEEEFEPLPHDWKNFHMFLHSAKAAIEAMREPNKPILDRFGFVSDQDGKYEWGRLIDAALKESE